MVEKNSHLRLSTASFFQNLSLTALDAQYEHILERFSTASSAADLSKLMDQIDQNTNELDSELAHFVAVASKKHTQQISAVELTRAKLSGAIANLSDLTQVFTSANDLGHSLTSKIKTLDQEIGNVDKTLSFVTDVQTLKNNINQIQYAIEKKDWELAAHCIHTINHKLAPNVVNGKFASVVIPSSDNPELPTPTIEKWIGELKEEFQTLFNDAAKRRSVPEISKYFQLFPLIDQEEVGLNCYSKFICSIITDTSRTLISSASQGDGAAKPGVYASVTTSLFESVSMMLSQHTPLIKKHYGESYPNAIVYVVQKIQREIDSQIGLISDTFYDTNRVDKVMQEIKLHTFRELNQKLEYDQEESDPVVVDNDLVSIVEVGDLIHEFSSILHHWSLYCKFVVTKYFNPPKPEGTKDEGLKLPSLLANSNYNKKIHSKYLPAFEVLYTFYFRRSLEKAITIEEIPCLEPYLIQSKESKSPEQAPVSSVIEDVTLVFNNTLRNVLDSSQPSTVRKFVSECFKVIQNDLLNGFIQKALQENQPRYNIMLTLKTPSANGVLSGAASPSLSRTGTPAPESVGSFFKGASNALGNVVGTGSAIVSGANPSGIPNNPKLVNFVIYLNTVASGQEFFEQIINNLTKRNPNYLGNNFPFGIDEGKISHIINAELLEPFVNATSNIIKLSLLNFFNQSLKSKVSSMVFELFPEATETNYVVYSSTVLNDPSTILRFKQSWDAISQPYKQTLHKTLVYEKLLRLLVVNIASMVEKKLMIVLKKFKINELGALKLDKDLSYAINEVCEDDYELREKFVRVTQLVLLVGMDNEEYELSSYKGNGGGEDEDEGGINWVLTPLERKQIRRFRI